MNNVQIAAFELIQADARFLYTITDIQKNAKNISSNYIMMSQPYIGIFADGAEQWCRKVGLDAPRFSKKEKEYYTSLRKSHKLLELTYTEYETKLMKKYNENDAYFYKIRRLREKIFGYYNIGTDLCNNKFCGNTVLCDLYTPIDLLGNEEAGIWIRDISVIVGEIAAFFECTNFPPYKYDDTLNICYRDYHFFKNCPLKKKTNLGFALFSILCSINYVIEFIENYFYEEIPQKLKFSYLLYYYLCDFIYQLNLRNGTNFTINTSFKNRNFRNCLAHYGLGQFLNEKEIIANDVLKGLTNKAFNMSYMSTKKEIYKILYNLVSQIENYIF